jgi:hypothetical protein
MFRVLVLLHGAWQTAYTDYDSQDGRIAVKIGTPHGASMWVLPKFLKSINEE